MNHRLNQRAWFGAPVCLALAAAGCGGDPVAPNTTGTIRAAASTIGDQLDPDGYTVTLDASTSKPLAPDGLATFNDVPPGTRTLSLEGVAPNCALEGPNPRTLSVAAGAVINAPFTVRCSARNGAIRVSLSTSGPMADLDGYTLLLDDASPTSIGLAGTVTFTPVPEGAHTVRLAGVASNCVVGGGALRTVSVEMDVSTSVSFAVTCTGEVGALSIETATSGSPIDPDGYQVVLDGGDSRPTPVSGTITLQNVAAGPHSLLLTGLAGNCAVVGTNPVSVTITAGGTTSHRFNVSCSSTSGSIRVLTQTSGSPVDPDGYAVSVDGGPAQAIGAAASVVIPDLGAGTHSVQLEGLASNCTTSANPRTVSVTAGTTAETAFDVACTPTHGTIEVIASTSGSPADPDGYTLRLDGGSAQSIDADGAVTYSNVPLGDHTIALSGLAGNCSVNGSNPRPVTVTGGATANVVVNISCSNALKNQIIFLSTRNGGHTDLYYMNEDGSNVRRLTTDSGDDQDAAISPDGTRVLFTSNRTGTFRVYVMNSDGTGVANLSGTGPGQDTDPEWSPDGRHIAFESSRNGFEEVYVMNADGTGIVQLTNDQGENGDVDWSPDGSRIVFETHRDGPNGEGEIYVMNANGTNLVNLTQSPTATDGDPAWSPDGRSVAFESNRSGNFDVWVVDADGSNLRRITSSPANDGAPTWSPDGGRIAFDSDRAGGGNFDVWVVQASGTNVVRLTTNSAFDGFPEWSRPSSSELVAMRPAQSPAPAMRISAAAPASEPAVGTARCRSGGSASGCHRSSAVPDWRARQ